MATEPTKQSGLSLVPDISKANFYNADEGDMANLQKAQEDALTALQQRYAQPNWFNVAAGFLKPQLGGFAASLGSASQAMGENLENQRASELTAAQMRSQIALTKMAVTQKQKAAAMESARLIAGDPVTAQYVAKLTNIAGSDSPQAQAAKDELTAMTQNRQLESSEVANLATQYGQALKNIELKLMNKGYKSQDELDADMARATQLYGPKSPSVVRPPNTSVGDKSNAGNVGAVPPPEAVVQPPAAGTVQPLANGTVPPPAAGAVSAPVATGKTIDAQDFLSKAVYPNESKNGTPNTTPGSTAIGKGQMIQKTRQGIHDKYHMEAGPEQYDKDPSVAAAYDYANLGENHAILTNNDPNKTPTALDHRILWAMGTGDGPKILAADPTQKLKDLGLYLGTQKDGFKNNNLNPNMSVGRYKAIMQGQLWDSGVDPEAKVMFGQQNVPAKEGVSAAPTTSVAAPTNITKQEKFPFVYADPQLTDPQFNRKTPDQQARILANVNKKADADEARSMDQINRFKPYGDQTIYTPYMSDLNSSIDMIDNNKYVAQRVFNILGQGTLKAEILKSIQEGMAAHGPFGSWSVSLPAKTWADAGLTEDDAAYANTLATKFLHINAYKNQINGQGNNPPPVAEFAAMLAKSANLNQPWDSALKTLKIDRANALHGNRIYNTILDEKDKVDQAHELAPVTAVLKHSKAYKAEIAAWQQNLADLNK